MFVPLTNIIFGNILEGGVCVARKKKIVEKWDEDAHCGMTKREYEAFQADDAMYQSGSDLVGIRAALGVGLGIREPSKPVPGNKKIPGTAENMFAMFKKEVLKRPNGKELLGRINISFINT